jgi:GNAT superfamily N-acetyltransferase
VANPEDLPEYAAAAQAGWSEEGEVAHLIAELARVMFAAKGYVGFMVRKNQRTIATAGLVIYDGVALLAGASTVPGARGQGAQRLVLAARLHYAAAAGCDLAMFVAEPGSASQRNAERSGFHIAYTRTKWLSTKEQVRNQAYKT